jgi:drug/metabolite transporter (DMT)-like permease
MGLLGEILALAAAFFWAIGVILFKKSGENMAPLSLNLFKNIIAMILFIPTIFLFRETFVPDQPLTAWFWLGLSGILGITLADTLFFISLNKLGASLVAVVDTSYTPILLTMSYFFLDDRMGLMTLFGAILITIALLVGSITKLEPGKTRKDIIIGTITGITGMFTMVVGIIIIKDILNKSPLIWAAAVRTFFGILGLIPIVLLNRIRRKKFLANLTQSQTWKVAAPAALSGSFLAMICWVGGLKHTDVSIAGMLNQLSTIFIFIMAIVWLKEPITWKRMLAIGLAFSGAMLVILR